MSTPAGFYKGYNYVYLSTNQVDAIDANSPFPAGLSLSQMVDQAYGSPLATTPSLLNGRIFVGNSSNVATAVPVSGDATLSNTGALTVNTVQGNTVLKNNFTAIAPPTPLNDASEGYSVGSFWYDTAGNSLYICEDTTLTDAIWTAISGVALAPGHIQVGSTSLDVSPIGNILVGAGATLASVSTSGDMDVTPSGYMQLRRVVMNTTGGPLNAGTLVTLSVHSTGQLQVTLASAPNTPATHVIANAVPDGAFVNVYPIGTVYNINTAAGMVGAPLYLSTTPGNFVTVPEGSLVQNVGAILTSDAVTGSAIFWPGFKSPTIWMGSNIQSFSVGPEKLTVATRKKIITCMMSGHFPTLTGADQPNNQYYLFTMPTEGVITAARLISSVSTSASALANMYSFCIRNTTTGDNMASVLNDTLTAELAANSPYALTIDQNNNVLTSHVISLLVNVFDNGMPGPTDLSGATFKLEIEYYNT